MVSFPQVSPSEPCIHLSSLPYALHAPSISCFLDFITRTILGEQYRSLSFSSCHAPMATFCNRPFYLPDSRLQYFVHSVGKLQSIPRSIWRDRSQSGQSLLVITCCNTLLIIDISHSNMTQNLQPAQDTFTVRFVCCSPLLVSILPLSVSMEVISHTARLL